MLAEYRRAIETYRKRVFSLAFYSLRAREDAEDITQDVFIRLWQHWPKVDQTRLGAWLMRVTHNAVVDHLRRRRNERRHVELDLVPGEVIADTTPEPESRQFRQTLQGAIGGLADPQRSVLIMRDVQGLAYGEIEQALELSQSQVKVYLHRARRQLREHPDLRRLALEQQLLPGTDGREAAPRGKRRESGNRGKHGAEVSNA